MLCGATQDGRVMVERSDRMWSTGEGNGKPLQYSCLENPMNSMKRQIDRILKEELPRSVGAQYATGDQWRRCIWIWVNSRSWWWTGRLGVLRFMGSQRLGHDWATELNWNWGSWQINDSLKFTRVLNGKAESHRWVWPQSLCMTTEQL